VVTENSQTVDEEPRRIRNKRVKETPPAETILNDEEWSRQAGLPL